MPDRDQLLDAAIALVVGVMAQVMVWSGHVAGPRAAMSALFLLVGPPLLLRRSRPLLPSVAVSIAIVVQAIWSGHSAEGLPLVLALNVTMYSVAAFGRRRDAILGASLFVILATTSVWQDPLARTAEERWAAAFWGLLPFVSLAAGFAIRWRRTTLRLERESQDQTKAHAEAVAEERSRMARELHDVIAHHVSVTVLQSVAAKGVLTADPARASGALGEIERSGRQALNELRRLLDVMRTPETSAPFEPQPGYEEVSSLVEGVRRAGIDAILTVVGEPPDSSDSLALATFRIVQESLTNVLKHANARHVDVQIDYGTDRATLDVVNDGEGNAVAQLGAGGGHGLIGMRERALLFGGSLVAAPRMGGGFAVHAVLPYPESA